MKIKGYIKLFCIVCALAISLSACLPRPANNGVSNEGGEYTEKEFTPAVDNGKDSELGSEYREIFALVEAGEGITLATDADFNYKDVEGGVKITKYIGNYEGENGYLILAIPETIGDKRVVSIGKEAFAIASKLDGVIIPDGVRTIESLCFYGCNYLKYVKIGSGLETVGDYAFSMCNRLFEIDLSTVESSGLGALTRCESINTVKLSFIGGTVDKNTYLGYIFGASNSDFNSEYIPTSLRNIILSDECKSIPDLAFYGCENLTFVIIPDSVESIGIRAFYKCRSLTEIKLGNGVRTVGDDAFFGCDSLKSATLGASLEGLGMQAFFGCSTLENISLSAKLDEIKSSTFYGCRSLKTIDLLNVRVIGEDAFYGCDMLTPPDTSRVETIAQGNGSLRSSEQ
ncbi:MAG: leucine-rich repeat domain-containing protein [Clostridia bacterium]|nr:leucine-rich repeat domain-containing protein [Clostridia bacterium]